MLQIMQICLLVCIHMQNLGSFEDAVAEEQVHVGQETEMAR